MKKSEIQVGNEYAVARGDWEFSTGRANRARVISTDGSVSQGYYSWNKKTITATVVQYLNDDGTEKTGRDGEPLRATVPNRQIRQDWESYSEHWKQVRAAQDERHRQTNEARAARAKRVPEIVAALRALGVEDSKDSLTRAGTALLLRYAPEFLTEVEGQGALARRSVVAPLADDIENFILSNGSFSFSADQVVAFAEGVR